ncbi:MAG: diguanylate cyclase domain-containing protein [Cuspidothrix sp.]
MNNIQRAKTWRNAILDIRSTISLGVGVFTPPDPNCTNLLSRADTALYQAKNNGRNQWAIAD